MASPCEQLVRFASLFRHTARQTATHSQPSSKTFVDDLNAFTFIDTSILFVVLNVFTLYNDPPAAAGYHKTGLQAIE